MEEDQVECDDNNVKKRKAPSKPRRTTSECWKYFDPKMEADENGNIIKFAYCKWCPAVLKADSRLHGTRQLNTHYMNCDKNPDAEKLRKQKFLAFKKKIGDNKEGVSSIGTLETWKYDEKDIKKALLDQRVTNFKENIEKTCNSKKFLVSECPTRWNSTHDMLKTVIELKEAFFYYDFNNSSFARDLEEIPKRVDFEVCRKVVSFLEKFKETTELVSNVSCPVSHLWFGEVLDIDKHLREWQHENASFKEMIEDMRKKYDKYWGDYKKINHYIYFAMILDPTMKLEMIGVGFRHLIENGCVPMEVDENDSDETPLSFLTDDEVCDKMVKKVENDMRVLFDMYKEKYGTNLSSDLPKPTSSQSTNTSSRRNSFFFKKQVGNNFSGVDDELTKYLKEPRLELEGDDYFDILNWWKLNSPRFPIVSKMEKGFNERRRACQRNLRGIRQTKGRTWKREEWCAMI
ncbi:zinc finger BED domain-containing protein RICESLEEPER 2 [Artemisia annua]|uniref:Zinc finger BED domain-containing protein RICESLEEPER 2 n=1 Tax=Artemisia annua TaxID=35608 RepID=A0A2U1KR02_ARTAN|nr:zinc finger BED domain-containing protein RICESLEEPER 2 [Artemisia annua]